MRKGIIGILLALFILFGLILAVTSMVGAQFGKTGEIIALCVVAAVLFAGYIKSKGEK